MAGNRSSRFRTKKRKKLSPFDTAGKGKNLDRTRGVTIKKDSEEDPLCYNENSNSPRGAFPSLLAFEY